MTSEAYISCYDGDSGDIGGAGNERPLISELGTHRNEDAITFSNGKLHNGIIRIPNQGFRLIFCHSGRSDTIEGSGGGLVGVRSKKRIFLPLDAGLIHISLQLSALGDRVCIFRTDENRNLLDRVDGLNKKGKGIGHGTSPRNTGYVRSGGGAPCFACA